MILRDELTEAEKFKEVFRAQVKRPGGAAVLSALDEIGFFEAPASTKYHGNYKGGLVEHSNNVCRRLLWLAADQAQREGRQRFSTETLVIVSLLHDICKARAYRETAEGGFVYNTNDYPYGHGEKSVYMIMNWMHLTDEEALAIRWHMGAYDTAARSDLRELSRAMEQSKLVTMLHLADMMATHLDESEGESMDGIELKRCPFCGREAHTFHIPENTKEERAQHPKWNWCNEGMWVVGCLSEMCMGNMNNVSMIFVTEDQAVEAWNKRA